MVIGHISILISGWILWYGAWITFYLLSWELRWRHFPICRGFYLHTTDISSILFLIYAICSISAHWILAIVSSYQFLSSWALTDILAALSIVGVALGTHNFGIWIFKEYRNIPMQWYFAILIHPILNYLHSFSCIFGWSYILLFLFNLRYVHSVLEPSWVLILRILRHLENMLALQQGYALSLVWFLGATMPILARLWLKASLGCVALLLVIMSWV